MNIIKNFIVFEGIDGAGTTTQTKLLGNAINNSIITCEPTDGEIGRFIRLILKKEFEIDKEPLAYLFVADRAEHLYGKNGIVEKCKEQVVISDRYLFSSLAYQSLDMPMDKVFEINKDFPLPEIIFFLDTPVKVSQKRLSGRENLELFEDKNLQEKVRDNYLRVFTFYNENELNIYTIDGSKALTEILEIELSILKKHKII